MPSRKGKTYPAEWIDKAKQDITLQNVIRHWGQLLTGPKSVRHIVMRGN